MITTPTRELDALADEYSLRDPHAISEFICRSPDVLAILKEAPNRIRPVFGADSKLALELITEPESRSALELFLLIVTNDDPESALSKLELLDRTWWLQSS